ncbi:MAG: ferrous iron transport protein B [Bacteroidetes bacterium 4572_117]|nr:MAG: ferrous iron transport protein B [Bacteroidetes bacterium 4572_117]
MNLSELQTGDKGVIVKVKGRGAFRKRITEMGFIKGKQITVIKNAPLKDPIEYSILGYDVSLRRSEAILVEVLNEESALHYSPSSFEGVLPGEILLKKAEEKSKIINVAFVGNPNCGKTTLFNFASGSKEHVGNYSGVTVDLKRASFKQNGYTFKITDLPGTYSLSAYSPEELYVRNFIVNETPDVIVNVVDASNLERNLYLTTQLIDMDVKVVCALNMFDELQKKGSRFDYSTLGKMIGIPFIPTVGSKGKGIKDLFNKVIDAYEDKAPTIRHIHINYGKGIEKSINAIQAQIRVKENEHLIDKLSSRFLAIKLLENDRDAHSLINQYENSHEIFETYKKRSVKIKAHLKEDPETVLTDARYGFIAGALKETFKEGVSERRKKTDLIDTFLTHKVFGYPIFIFFIWLMFQSTFSLGQYPMDWIDTAVQALSSLIQSIMPAGMLKDLIIDGIIGGVGSVIIFLPNILILFFFISLMEDTGYMARVAFIMDKIMHKVGLHGKSFIPMIMGFGCNVPAIMATRTLENRNDRILTILINPFMSCSARLPVYLIIIAAVFPNNASTVLFSLYFFGIFLAALFGIIFKKLIFKSKEAPFVMELPPYRMPTIKSTTIHMWHKGQQYLQKMGGVILIASILIWSLGYFPRTTDSNEKYDSEVLNIKTKIKNINTQIKINNDTLIQDQLTVFTQKLDSIDLLKENNRQSSSYIGRIGRFVEPVMTPLGFDWKISVSLLTGIAAKEVVVSTMGVLYQANAEADENSESLKNKIKRETYKTGDNSGQTVFSPIVAMSFLLFILIYFPCIAVIAAVKKETGHWKWALFMVVYTTGLAWFVSFVTFQVGKLIIG